MLLKPNLEVSICQCSILPREAKVAGTARRQSCDFNTTRGPGSGVMLCVYCTAQVSGHRKQKFENLRALIFYQHIMEESQDLIAAVTAPDIPVTAPSELSEVVEPLNLKSKKRVTQNTPRPPRPRTSDERWVAAVAQLNDQLASDTKKPAPKVRDFGLRRSHPLVCALPSPPDSPFILAHCCSASMQGLPAWTKAYANYLQTLRALDAAYGMCIQPQRALASREVVQSCIHRLLEVHSYLVSFTKECDCVSATMSLPAQGSRGIPDLLPLLAPQSCRTLVYLSGGALRLEVLIVLHHQRAPPPCCLRCAAQQAPTLTQRTTVVSGSTKQQTVNFRPCYAHNVHAHRHVLARCRCS